MDTQDISIILPLKAWNVVLAAMATRPFNEVADIIAAVRSQAETQLAAAALKDKDAEAIKNNTEN